MPGKEPVSGRASINPIDKNKDGFELDKTILKHNIAQIEENPLSLRIFTHVAQTSTAIQVAWSHPSNFQKLVKTQNADGTTITQK